MHRAGTLLLTLAVLTVGLAGCVGNEDPTTTPTSLDYAEGYPKFKDDGLYHFEFTAKSGALAHVEYAPGAISRLKSTGDATVSYALPETALVIDAEGPSFQLVEGPIEVAPGETVEFLAPPSAHPLNVTVDGDAYTMDPAEVPGQPVSQEQIISGENWYDLMAYQEEHFPHREPGGENYWKSIGYFESFFTDLGYEVEVDPYGTHDLSADGATCAVARGTTYCPESVANVVATKPGTNPDAGIIFVAGGHFDMVNNTRHAAFDDTSGTIATLELARVLAPYEFEHTLMFGLWGGEENGLLGSQFWVRTNPDKVQQTKSYFNLDVVGMSWPAPKLAPDPVMIAAGPDAPGGQSGETADPVSQDMLTWARTLQQDWFAFPDEVNGTEMFLYEGVASGQATGAAGVNAQSDHTPFIGAGVPSYFIFNADALDTQVALHTPSDTLTNMTKYALFENQFEMDDPTWPSEEIKAEAEEMLAQSMEATLFFPLYHAILVDLGVYTPPANQNAS